MQTMTQTTKNFPFSIEHLKSWSIKRQDGSITKYVLSTAIDQADCWGHTSTTTTTTPHRSIAGYSSYCSHNPSEKKNPLVTFPRTPELGELRLWVANMSGARASKNQFDFVLDAGNILDLGTYLGEVLTGDQELVSSLSQYSTLAEPTRLLKMDWDDREAPYLQPQFWEELNKKIYGDVMTCCVGGHGRSGSTFVCLLLANAPDYDALDAIVHTRAVHCPRAIESAAQHNYINEVAEYFGREPNAKAASTISDYKGAFLASKKPTAVRTRQELEWEK